MLPVFGGGSGPSYSTSINGISRSLRFNSADSAYLDAYPVASGDRRVCTWSGWVKRADLGTDQHIFNVEGTTDDGMVQFRFNASNQLQFVGYSTIYRTSTQLFRDPGAWYHIIFAVDTRQENADDRIKIYVNGLQITAFDTKNNPVQNFEMGFNSLGRRHSIGRRWITGAQAFAGYLTEVHFVDGVALTPSEFGMYDPVTKIWSPKEYTYQNSYYGQNGFYLPFKNNANTTALGFDYSGSTYARYNATAVGGARISTDKNKFGGSSAYIFSLYPSGQGIITVPDSPGFAFGSGDFTIEFWANAAAALAGNRQFLIYQGNNAGLSTTVSFQIELNTARKIKADVFSGSTGYTIISGSNFANDTFRHVALVRNGNTLSLYVDGSSVGSVSVTGVSLNDSSDLLKIGDYSTDGNTGATFFGYVDDLRIYKGIAKYTANFTPPTAALPLGKADPNWQYCSLAMPMDGTNNSTVFPVYAPFNWTPNNLSVTAGAGNDSLIDVPTRYADGGNNRGNYCVLNPLSGVGATISNGNLDVTIAAGTSNLATGTIGVTSGKWYWEITVGAMTSNAGMIGVCNLDATNAQRVYSGAEGWYYYAADGNKYNNNSSVSYGLPYVANDVIGVALDMDSGSLSFYKNGITQGSAYANSRSLIGKTISVALGNGTSGGTQAYQCNFGQRPFNYTPPAGYKALNTYNLQNYSPSYVSNYFLTQHGGYVVGVYNNKLYVVSPKSTERFQMWKIDVSSSTGTSSSEDGYANTNAMNNAQHPAAQYVRSLLTNGYSDWFLPAKNEISFLYTNKSYIPSAEGFESSISYWSSTEISPSWVETISFTSGAFAGYYKTDADKYVRAVRAISIADCLSIYGGYPVGIYNGYLIIVSPKSVEVTRQWKTTSSATANTSSTTNGLANTDAMNNADHPAAQYCRSLTTNGYTDWYLPAKDELNFLYTNRANMPSGQEFTSTGIPIYWSSTEYSTSTSAWLQRFDVGTVSASTKIVSAYIVRPIRRIQV